MAKKSHGNDSFNLRIASVTDFEAVRDAVEGVDCIYHLAGQVAVTTSVSNPRQDFEDNCLGTFNVWKLPVYQETILSSYTPVQTRYMAALEMFRL
jgi:nucleoside-diphosphate-sugar epimerase